MTLASQLRAGLTALGARPDPTYRGVKYVAYLAAITPGGAERRVLVGRGGALRLVTSPGETIPAPEAYRRRVLEAGK